MFNLVSYYWIRITPHKTSIGLNYKDVGFYLEKV